MTDIYSPTRDAAFSLIRSRYGNFTGNYQSETEKEEAQRGEAGEIHALLSSLDRTELFVLVNTLTQIGLIGLIKSIEPDTSVEKANATLDQWRMKLP
jgi:hypothetical protein